MISGEFARAGQQAVQVPDSTAGAGHQSASAGLPLKSRNDRYDTGLQAGGGGGGGTASREKSGAATGAEVTEGEAAGGSVVSSSAASEVAAGAAGTAQGVSGVGGRGGGGGGDGSGAAAAAAGPGGGGVTAGRSAGSEMDRRMQLSFFERDRDLLCAFLEAPRQWDSLLLRTPMHARFLATLREMRQPDKRPDVLMMREKAVESLRSLEADDIKGLNMGALQVCVWAPHRRVP